MKTIEEHHESLSIARKKVYGIKIIYSSSLMLEIGCHICASVLLENYNRQLCFTLQSLRSCKGHSVIHSARDNRSYPRYNSGNCKAAKRGRGFF